MAINEWKVSEPVLLGAESEKKNQTILDLKGLFLRQICNGSQGGNYQPNCMSSKSIKNLNITSNLTCVCLHVELLVPTQSDIYFKTNWILSHSHTHKTQPLFS